jgi:hypothetical protein
MSAGQIERLRAEVQWLLDVYDGKKRFDRGTLREVAERTRALLKETEQASGSAPLENGKGNFLDG